MSYEFQVYQDNRREYRWRFVAPNGRTMADSSEGYRAKSDCLAAIATIKREAPTASVKDPITAAAAYSGYSGSR